MVHYEGRGAGVGEGARGEGRGTRGGAGAGWKVRLGCAGELARGAVSRGASASAPARHSERGRAACRSSGWLYGFIGLECR